MAAECKTIYVDLDDVLCQAARHFLMIVERVFGKKIGFAQLTNFDVGYSCGLTPVECDELYRIVHLPDELMSMEPIGEAVEVLTKWLLLEGRRGAVKSHWHGLPITAFPIIRSP
jgi:hypothetical protein